MKVCECCGHPLPGDEVRKSFRENSSYATLYDVVRKSGQLGIVIDRIEAVMPYYSPRYIQVLRCQLNKKLEPHGLRISRAKRSGFYRLETLEPQ